MALFKIVNTDNFGGDYPDEKFLSQQDDNANVTVLVFTNKGRTQQVADALNGPRPDLNPRYWKVVDDTYELHPGFEP